MTAETVAIAICLSFGLLIWWAFFGGKKKRPVLPELDGDPSELQRHRAAPPVLPELNRASELQRHRSASAPPPYRGYTVSDEEIYQLGLEALQKKLGGGRGRARAVPQGSDDDDQDYPIGN